MRLSPLSLTKYSSPPSRYSPVRAPSATKSPAGERYVHCTSERVRSSLSASPMFVASGLNMSGKLSKSLTCTVCSGLTYRLPAPPTTSRRTCVPLKMSHRCLREVLCRGSVSGVQAPNASMTASNPMRSSRVRSNKSLTIVLALGFATLSLPRTKPVTSYPRETASSTNSLPCLPAARTTATFFINHLSPNAFDFLL